MGILDAPVLPSYLNRGGLASNRPAASLALAGVTYTYTDAGSATYTGRVDRCDGTAWIMIVPPTGTYAFQLPTAGSITYNADGTVATDADGVSYTYNADGTVHTAAKGGVTRTFTYNADGTIASVA